MLTERQEKILGSIVEEYIDNAVPISSQAVFEASGLEISCPTIRNEMADLTELGYLVQPHTSAGRVPTEQGYRFFVDDLLQECQKKVNQKLHSEQSRSKLSNAGVAAREISMWVNDAVLFLGEDGELRYVGLKKLFSNPEFRTNEAIVSLINELEHFENSVANAAEKIRNIERELEIFIGSENPFFESTEYSMMVSPQADGFISILGPTRMNYRKNISILEKFLQYE